MVAVGSFGFAVGTGLLEHFQHHPVFRRQPLGFLPVARVLRASADPEQADYCGGGARGFSHVVSFQFVVGSYS